VLANLMSSEVPPPWAFCLNPKAVVTYSTTHWSDCLSLTILLMVRLARHYSLAYSKVIVSPKKVSKYDLPFSPLSPISN